MRAKILRNLTRLQPTEVLVVAVVGALYLPVFGLVAAPEAVHSSLLAPRGQSRNPAASRSA